MYLVPYNRNYLEENIINNKDIVNIEEDLCNLFVINDISYEERKEQHIDFSFHVHCAGYSSPLTISNSEILVSETEQTTPFEDFYNNIIKYFRMHNWQINYLKKDDDIKVTNLIPNININVQLICELFKKYGWCITSYGFLVDKDSLKWVALSFKPLFEINNF